jgi:hypothetical protein
MNIKQWKMKIEFLLVKIKDENKWEMFLYEAKNNY